MTDSGAVAYRGAYQTTNGTLNMDWEGWSTAGAWGATGTLNGDLLTVRYNLIMQLTDFDDATYRLEAQPTTAQHSGRR